MGHVVDAIDVDPRNGGSLEALKEALGGEIPTVYGRASTPSGGEHYLVASMNVRTLQNATLGVDIQAGNTEGVGRGFIFLAPTVRKSKEDGELRSYAWELDPDLGLLLLEEDDSGSPLRELVNQLHGPGKSLAAEYDGPTYDDLDEDQQREASEHVAGHLVLWKKRFEEAIEWPEEQREDGGRQRGWEGLTYQFAWAIAKMAACPWTAFDEEGAEVSFYSMLPPEMDEACPGKWYEGIVVQAAEEPVDTPPWVVRGSPFDDFSKVTAKTAWPSVPERFTDAYLCAWMVHKGLEGDWCWAGGLGWLRWNGKHWVPGPEEAVIEAVRQSMLRVNTAIIATGDSDLIKVAASLLSSSRIRAVAGLMKGVASVAAGRFDQQNDLLNVGNGVVDLATGDLLPHDRKLLLTRFTEADYEPGARHPDWDACLKSLDPEVMSWMQVRFGQAATGWPTSDDVLPVGVGGGSNGKSTLLAGLFSALGDHMMMVPDKLLRASPGDHPTELMSLFGARVAVIEETPEAGQLNVQRLKAVLGTPKMVSRGVFKDNTSWTATHSLFLMTNFAPQVREADYGTWRRLALIKFNKTFPKKDNFRQDMLRGLEGRREAVLAWVVEGAVSWYENGGTIPDPPEQVAADTRTWRGESDQVLAFIDEGHIEFDPAACVLTSELHEIFNKWLLSRGYLKWSSGTLTTRLSEQQNFKKIARIQLNGREGISLHPEVISEPPKRPWVWKGIKWADLE
jgi:P4 family phage/plasmid primase-like protien